MDKNEEHVVLVNDKNEVLGTAPKAAVHTGDTPLHRAFSSFIFNGRGEILLQQRSPTKDTEPGFWDISCGGHVTAGQSYEETAPRELQEELGISTPIKLLKIHLTRLNHETEFSAVFKGYHHGPFQPHPQEIAALKFFRLHEIKKLRLTEQVTINLRQVFKIL